MRAMRQKEAYRLGAAVAACISMALSPEPARAADPAANFVTHLFVDACVPNIGRPDHVRAWAEAKHLPQVTDPVPLAIFVGPGGRGAAWAAVSDAGQFALSLRGETEACAVWARHADPRYVELYFRGFAGGLARAGVVLKTFLDKTIDTPYGAVRELVFETGVPTSPRHVILTLLVAEHPGGPFQVSIQAAMSGSTDDGASPAQSP